MKWLDDIVDELVKRCPDGEIIVSSGVSPSGIYHIGHLREVLTADAVYLALKKKGREVRHLHIVDDLDALRKIPANIPESHNKYLGMPLCDVPAPDGSDGSYADFFFNPFLESTKKLGIEMEIFRSHVKYRAGYFVPAIEKVLTRVPQAKKTLETISQRRLDPKWSPIQVMEGKYLKNRKFLKIDKPSKTIFFEDSDGKEQRASYDKGEVKLDWRLDWPARWWLIGVNAEPFGRDHATKGGSYDTGVGLMKTVYDGQAPIPVPYDFINRAGDTKKMSASKGTGIDIGEALDVLPPEVLRFFVLRYAPGKLLAFDSGKGTVQLMDDFAELMTKKDKTTDEKQLAYLCNKGIRENIVSNVPFSHLVASYQAALEDHVKTMEIVERTEHGATATGQKKIIERELKFIDAWLKRWAPEEVKFALTQMCDASDFNEQERDYLKKLADKIEVAPRNADGEWFHKAIYDFKESAGLEPKVLFSTLYRAIIGKESGPRAGWFLSILPRDWLVKRLRFES